MGICKAPFSAITLDQDLTIRPCCVSEAKVGQFKAPEDLKEAFEGSLMSEIRKSFLNGKYPE